MTCGGRAGEEHGVVAPVRVDPTGVSGPTKRQAAGPEWRQSSRGLYVPAHVEQDPAQRIVEAGVLAPTYGAVTGWAGLRWYEGRWFTGTDRNRETRPVPMALSRRTIRPQPLIQLCGERYDPRETREVDGIRVASPVRATTFEMRYALSLDDAVVALDMACFDDLVSVEEVRTWVDGHPSYTGIEQARLAVRLGDENAWSPAEVTMRIDWPVGPVLTNRPVFDLDGRHLGTPDLIDPVTGVTGEHDGELHLTAVRRAHDLRREDVLRAHGLEPVVRVAADLRDPGPYRERVSSAYLRAQRLPASERRWTLELPHWWRPTFTVAQRRSLDEVERGIWLRRQAS